MLEIMLIAWSVAALVLQAKIIPNQYAKLTALVIIAALIASVLSIVIRCKVKKEPLKTYLKIDMSRFGELFGFQVIKLAMAGVILTQFVRVDMSTITNEYTSTVVTMADIVGVDHSDESVEYMLNIAPIVPICVKQYMTANMRLNMFNAKYSIITDTLGNEVNDDQYAILMQGLEEEGASINEVRAAAKSDMLRVLSYALIYIFANVARDIFLKRRDKYRSTDEYKKRDIFEGVNLRGD